MPATELEKTISSNKTKFHYPFAVIGLFLDLFKGTFISTAFGPIGTLGVSVPFPVIIGYFTFFSKRVGGISQTF
ncbi:hypothetical protein CN683_28795 [Bacillus toyonensis]|uniref:hypothetical protein n=1 Tax=Bacillus toyonensis TaxID=155322 RepID=UPI000BEFCAD3|nr:hypothetical protein [Bacillus toyonensis]PEK09417.1 hypothetical protein CN683_28795 [Bacillus toyonensis]PGC78993.1 hypothetical protein COM29_29085 [Bacillus toyonensis]